MCYALYLGSSHPLPVCKDLGGRPEFAILELTEDEEAVRGHFSQPYVYYLASHEGCGCGFFTSPAHDNDNNDRNKRRDQKCRISVRALVELLNDELLQQQTLELLVSWEGKQQESIARREVLTPEDFLTGEFPLDEQEFAVITSV